MLVVGIEHLVGFERCDGVLVKVSGLVVGVVGDDIGTARDKRSAFTPGQPLCLDCESCKRALGL